MKKIMAVVMVLLLVGMIMPVFAEEVTKQDELIVKTLREHPLRGGLYYNVDDNEWDSICGFVIKEKNGINLNFNHDGNEAVFLGLDVTGEVLEGISIGIGLVGGFNRIENIFKLDMGEFKWGPSIEVKIKI